MICKLKGTVDEILENGIVIDVNGVGYFVHSSDVLLKSVKLGDFVQPKIYHVFKQDSQMLCGFSNTEELFVFKALLDVQGVGIRIAMAVLSKLSPQEFAAAVANQDVSLLCVVNGVGEKMARRILLELKDKTLTKIKNSNVSKKNNINDAILGLVSLGYQKEKIYKIIFDVIGEIGEAATPNEIIVNCLRKIK